MEDMTELETLMKEMQGKPADELTNGDVARFLDLFDLAKIVAKKAEQTAFKRLQAGKKIPGRKLGPKRAFRKWKDEKKATGAAVKEFGDDALTVPALKSPAQIDELPKGTSFTTRYAHKPDTGLTVLKASDPRREVSKDTKSMFQPVKKGKK